MGERISPQEQDVNTANDVDSGCEYSPVGKITVNKKCAMEQPSTHREGVMYVRLELAFTAIGSGWVQKTDLEYLSCAKATPTEESGEPRKVEMVDEIPTRQCRGNAGCSMGKDGVVFKCQG